MTEPAPWPSISWPNDGRFQPSSAKAGRRDALSLYGKLTLAGMTEMGAEQILALSQFQDRFPPNPAVPL
jgi:hypothetical protein